MSAHHDGEGTRRDFLYVATMAVGAVGTGYAAWRFVDYLNPDAAVLAQASTEVNVSDLEVGQTITVMWRGSPVFIRNRTKEEIEKAKAVAIDSLPDENAQNKNLNVDAKATDENRAVPSEENYIIMIANCTHFGCVPTGEAGDYGGWFCPCHGSHYDTAGRIRKGPAPFNLYIPPYRKDGDMVVIG